MIGSIYSSTIGTELLYDLLGHLFGLVILDILLVEGVRSNFQKPVLHKPKNS